MAENDADRSPLVPERAFVVQFRAAADLSRDQTSGRVEHVMSGQAMHFDTLDQLLTFVSTVLRQISHS